MSDNSNTPEDKNNSGGGESVPNSLPSIESKNFSVIGKGRIYAPGTLYGVCEGGCEHPACNYAEALAKLEKCVFCGTPIGYNRDYFISPTNELAHAACYNPNHKEGTLEDNDQKGIRNG